MVFSSPPVKQSPHVGFIGNLWASFQYKTDARRPIGQGPCGLLRRTLALQTLMSRVTTPLRTRAAASQGCSLRRCRRCALPREPEGAGAGHQRVTTSRAPWRLRPVDANGNSGNGAPSARRSRSARSQSCAFPCRVTVGWGFEVTPGGYAANAGRPSPEHGGRVPSKLCLIIVPGASSRPSGSSNVSSPHGAGATENPRRGSR